MSEDLESLSHPSPPSGQWQPPSVETIQALFPQYEITEILGRGGMGAVYKGWQRSLDRFVAIKILPPGFATGDSHYAERFKREAKSMARLNHPGIVAVHDAGETADGMLYFVMEFVEGTDVLKMLQDQRRLPSSHAAAIIAHICDALQYAHERGVVHRDIKPANIMVGYDGVVKVADFGLAKMEQPGMSSLTQTGTMMGTLHYMAPEALILGSDTDHRVDIYAVGVMLYQMLTGTLPQGMFEMPSQKVPDVDPRYDALVAKAMREDRELRYQSAYDLRMDLDTILTQPVMRVAASEFAGSANLPPPALPTAARPAPPTGYVVPKPRQLVVQKKSSPLPLLITAMVVIGGGYLAYQWKLVPRDETPAPQTSVEKSPSEAKSTAPVAEKPPASTPNVTTAPATNPTAPAMMPTATPKPEAPATVPKGEIDARLATLENGFKNAATGEPEKTYQASMAGLNKSYLGALDRALGSATQAGKLEDAVALREEKQRMESGQGITTLLEESTLTRPVPETLKNLRGTYRSTQGQHDAVRARALIALYDKYEQALDALQAELTKAAKLDDALRVKDTRTQISSRKTTQQEIAAAAKTAKPVMNPTPSTPAASSSASSTQLTSGFTNSLGMRFVEIPGTDILMCMHEARFKDYATFANQVQGLDTSWRDKRPTDATGPAGEDMPVTNVNWEDAAAFCGWLAGQEGRVYRLPTDEEWSVAVGISRQEKPFRGTPLDKMDNKVPDVYPWGEEWPPKANLGNYADSARRVANPSADYLQGYSDRYPYLAPVMSYPPNKLGLHDLGGNVWEWCQDWRNPEKTERVARGASFVDWVPGIMLSGTRGRTPGTGRAGNFGFRVVLEKNGRLSTTAKTVATPSPPKINASAIPPAANSSASSPKSGEFITAAEAAALVEFTNSLGMRFVKVPDTKVLMCIHETRYKDYAVYAAAVPTVNEEWKNQRLDNITLENGDACPVFRVSWEDCQSFCAWLSQKEGRVYRLPTDEEWSYAVGIGRREQRNRDTLPRTLSARLPGVYPWGGQWPPPAGAGNLPDETRKLRLPNIGANYIAGYNDGFVNYAPVMSFQPNRLGLYDMSGNVFELCQEWFDELGRLRLHRGGCWDSTQGPLLSAGRFSMPDGSRAYNIGFRLVIEVKNLP